MATSPAIEVNTAATRARLRKLRGYVTENLLADAHFLCAHHADCFASRRPLYAFREGTMSHLGRRFDLLRNGRPLRIVVVGQESGRRRTRPAYSGLAGRRRRVKRGAGCGSVSLASCHAIDLDASGVETAE